MNNKRLLTTLGTLLLVATSQSSAQTTFDHDRAIALTALAPGLLTEGAPGPPVLSVAAATMGLVPADEIDALSFGDDRCLDTIPAPTHRIIFSVDGASVGQMGTGVNFEINVDSDAPPGGDPPAAAGDLFRQDCQRGNALARNTAVFGPGGVGFLYVQREGYDSLQFSDGEESFATWATPCLPGFCDDIDAFDYSTPPIGVTGVYFSLKAGSPSLIAPGFTPGDILYSDLTGTPPVVACLQGGVLATDVNLGIPGEDLDALNLIGSLGGIGAGGGIIESGTVCRSIAAPTPPASTHLIEYSVAPGGAFSPADILLRVGNSPMPAGVHTTAAQLGLLTTDNVNALECKHGRLVIPFFSVGAKVFLIIGYIW